MISEYEQFLESREYLRNCTKKTLRYYRQAWDVWGKLLPEPVEKITSRDVEKIVIALRKNPRLSVVSVKTYLRALNVFLKYLEVVPRVDLKSIQIPKTMPTLFSPDQVKTILHAEPRSTRETRVALAVAIVADSGLRAEEVLNIRKSDVDIDALSLRVDQGKGRKDRVVPISQVLRKRLLKQLRENPDHIFLLSTRSGTPLTYRNSLRDLKLFCSRLGVSGPRISWHTLRHSFATNYIRRGGDVTMLQRVLGHTTLAMTQRYVHLQTEDLRRVCDRYTMVS